MSHIVVKLYAGRSEQQKAELTARVTQAVMTGVQCTDAAVSAVSAPMDLWVRRRCPIQNAARPACSVGAGGHCRRLACPRRLVPARNPRRLGESRP
jgi:hypothetical protein